MIIIDKDPNLEIPQISEKFLDKYIIFCNVIAFTSFLSIVLKEGNNVFERGIDLCYNRTEPIKWSDNFNRNNKSLIQLMTKEFATQRLNWKIKFLISKDINDIKTICNMFNIARDSKFEQLILTQYNKINNKITNQG